MDSYDAVPYESTPFHESHPWNLAVQARVFGMEAPDPDRARVLELGCASGGNLVPMAWHLPDASFVGIELSAAQVATACRLIEDLDIPNIRIHAGDVGALPPDLGEYDYIIAHGLYSWIPREARTALMGACARHLAPTGIAYVSYNTLPGWRLAGMLRDMVLYQTRKSTGAAETLALARQFLDRLQRVLHGNSALHAQFLRLEIERIQGAHPSYLAHEHLEEVNEPVLFADFMAEAAAAGLGYLCDADIRTMFSESAGSKAAERWVDDVSDVIEREQLMDFLVNRRYRATLLCHAGREPEGEIDLDTFEQLSFHALLVPRQRADFRRVKEQPYDAADGSVFHVSHPLTRAALGILAENYPDSIATTRLADQAAAALRAAGNDRGAAEREHLVAELASLYLRHGVGLDLRERQFNHVLGERPLASRLARTQGGNGVGHLTTPRHRPLKVDDFAGRFVTLLDGSRTLAEVIDLLADEVAAGKFSGIDRGPATGATVRENCEQLLAGFARQGLLEKPDACSGGSQ